MKKEKLVEKSVTPQDPTIAEEVAALLERHPELTEREARELRLQVKGRQPVLGQKKADELRNLFFRGHSCQEIAEYNHGISMGMVVRARVDYKWDDARREYLYNLMREAQSTVQQKHYETIRFITDSIAVYEKAIGEKQRKYLQTGDSADLAGIEISQNQYSKFIDLLLKLTGQDKPQIQKIEHSGTIGVQPVLQPPTVPIDRPIEAVESRNVLKSLIEGKKLAKTEED